MNDQIKKLQSDFARWAAVESAGLRRSGISNDLAAQYVRSAWLIRLGRGVFMHTGDQSQLDPALVLLKSKIEGLHIAAKLALACHGNRPNLSASESVVLWGAAKGRLLGWFVQRFAGRYNRTQLFSPSQSAGLCRLAESPTCFGARTCFVRNVN